MMRNLARFNFVFFLSLFTLFFLFSSSVFAFSVEHSEVTNKVAPGETAAYLLEIHNDLSKLDNFVIESDPFAALPFSDIIESIVIDDTSVQVGPNSTVKIPVFVRMLSSVVPGKTYRTSLIVRSEALSVEQEEPLVVTVVSPKDLISVETTLPERVIPGKGLTFDVKLRNTINTILDSATVIISSELFEEQRTVKIFPYQELTIPIKFDVLSSTSPGIYALDVVVFESNTLRGQSSQEFEIVKNPNIHESLEQLDGFLQDRFVVTKTNNGNYIVEERFSLPVSSLSKPFTRASVPPTEKREDSWVWVFELAPGESFNLVAVKDYRSLFVLFLVLVFAGVILYYFATRKVTISKSIFTVKEDDQGVSNLKVMLHVKNRSKRVEHVKIMDILPELVTPSKEFGTLSPDNIQRGVHGIRLTWELATLEPGEERVVSYMVHSKMRIIGKLTLPNAIVQFRKAHKLYTVYSNRVTYYSKAKG
ncbi:hypothetical protein J4430_01670 [Candidatus Woesearchaeota archaeon]|nr:hypothetical protein [Candidatus Woesearchaeota archaeon]